LFHFFHSFPVLKRCATFALSLPADSLRCFPTAFPRIPNVPQLHAIGQVWLKTTI